MYKLLIVTNRPEIHEAVTQVPSWENLGFRPPRLALSAKAALDCLQSHHIDGIAFDLPPEEASLLSGWLWTTYTQMPVFEACDTVAGLVNEANKLRVLLNFVHADFAEDQQSTEERMTRCRHQFFRELISGGIHSRQELHSRLRLLRSRMDPEKPCILAGLSAPKDDDFLHGRWHYGPDRLEVAMRNFFGAELKGMRILVTVLSDERIFMLACPMRFDTEQMSEESMTNLVTAHTQDSIAHVREYLDLDLRITSERVLPSLDSLIES